MTTGHVPPHDALAEQSLLASLLAHPDDLVDALDLVRAEDFYGRQHQVLFRTIVDVDASGAAVDMLTVHQALRAHGADSVVPSDYLAELTSAPVGSVTHAARAIRARARQRAVLAALTELLGQGREPSTNPDEWVEAVQHRVLSITEETQPNRPEDIIATIKSVIETIEERQRGNYDYVPTVLSSLNQKIHGWDPGFHVLAARPGCGKTSYALQEAVNFAERGRAAVVCSIEMDRDRVTAVLLSQLGGVDNELMNTGKLEPEDWSALSAGANKLAKLPIAIIDDPAPTVTDVRLKYRRAVAELKRKHPKLDPGILVVDYVQLVTGQGATREQEVASVSRGLRAMAKEFGIVVLALSQLNRESTKDNRRPRLSDLRESGQLEQDAAKVVFIYNPNANANDGDQKNGRIFIVAKVRGGGKTGNAFAVFDGPTTRFSVPAHESHDWCDEMFEDERADVYG